MAKASKRKAPSRVRYEQGHPTVSCRVSKDIYDRLTQAKQADGKSFADILKIGLGKQEVQAKKVREAKKQGWDEGYKKAYADAALRYNVIYHCIVCGQAMEITSTEEKKAVDEFMREHGWGHKTCHERRQ